MKYNEAMEEHEGDEEREQRGPRVVDKRISARGAASAESQPHVEQQPQPTQAAPDETASPQGEPAERVWTPEQEAEARAMVEQINSIHARDWIGNTALTMLQVADVKLHHGKLDEASLAIDSLAALLNGVGSRLGEAEPPLRQTLAQLQMAYARLSTQQGQPPSGG